jgi:hypothetical protein
VVAAEVFTRVMRRVEEKVRFRPVKKEPVPVVTRLARVHGAAPRCTRGV